MSNEVIARRCRRSPTGVEDCFGSTGGTGGTGGTEGPTGPTGPAGIDADTPDIEAFANTVDGETLTPISLAIPLDQSLAAGARWLGYDAAGNVLIHETTFFLKNVGGVITEVGAHDNGDIRDVTQIIGASTDYVPTLTGVDFTVTGVIGTPISWVVQVWYSLFPIA